MDMNDYIHKAVELADGWHLGTDYLYCEDQDHVIWYLEDVPQLPKDSLAAQLVRQVELSGDYYVAQYGDGRSSVNQYSGTQQLATSIRGEGDRTMNTIKAIVDSGVLEHGH